MNTPRLLIVHHSGGSDANPLQDSSNYTVAQCNEDHRLREFPVSSLGYYVGYQYVITKNGLVTQCRVDTEEGAHTIGHNFDSIGIMLCGNFDATLPTDSQIAALKQLLQAKMTQWDIPATSIFPHRKFAIKTCYGRKLADDWAQKLVSPTATPKETIPSLIAKMISQNSAKDFKGAKDTSSLLFTEFGKLS